jgi:hypothetical protein
MNDQTSVYRVQSHILCNQENEDSRDKARAHRDSGIPSDAMTDVIPDFLIFNIPRLFVEKLIMKLLHGLSLFQNMLAIRQIHGCVIENIVR